MNKRSILPFIATALIGMLAMISLTTSCDPKGSKKRLQESYDSLRLENAKATQDLNDILTLIDSIETDLSKLTEAEHLVQLGTTKGDLAPSAKEKIKAQIESLNQALNQNKQKLEEQAKLLKKKDINLSALTRKIKRLEVRLSEKEEIIADLEAQIGGLNRRLSEQADLLVSYDESDRVKQTTIDLQNKKIQHQEALLNTAHYCFGTLKELKEQNILTGGGLFSSMKVLPDGFNKDYFLSIDIREVKSIALFAPRAIVRTSHPTSSYHFVNDLDGNKVLQITNPQEFWKENKYLVIEVEPK